MILAKQNKVATFRISPTVCYWIQKMYVLLYFLISVPME